MFGAKRSLLLAVLGIAGIAVTASAQEVREYNQRETEHRNVVGQNWDDRRDRDDRWGRDGRMDREDRQAYRDGYRDGRTDAQSRRRAKPRPGHWRGDERRAYLEGYEDGLRGRTRDWRDRNDDGYPDRGRGNDGWYGRDRDVYRSPAYRFGAGDGEWAANVDRTQRKGYHPTDSHNYNKADRGYDPRFGSKDDYKRVYRQAYREAYDRTYYARR